MTTTAYEPSTAESFIAAGQKFMIEQRNVGFASNDGRWILTLLPELYWSAGLLKMRRSGRFVGDFSDRLAAMSAAGDVPQAPELPRLEQFIP